LGDPVINLQRATYPSGHEFAIEGAVQALDLLAGERALGARAPLIIWSSNVGTFSPACTDRPWQPS